ncbi:MULTISPECIES: hypothetical protein [Leisingera]|uniref:hypothetical protein n=1 Tax=Leisingera TaxID=191028 RepID=UPI001CF85D7C|nr:MULTISPECIES: hypothetical protein [Leisingera]MCB4454554.1 hypothetical protein [Leisingera sp. McT4-56]
MHNETASGQSPVFQSVRSEAGKARINAAVASFQNRPGQVQPSTPEKIAAIKAGFDLRAMGPQDIDRMFDALVQAGHPMTAPMLLLNSMGERFRSHLSGLSGSAYDGSRQLDLIAVAQLQIQRARKQGGSSAGWESFLAFLMPQPPQERPAAQPPVDHMARLAQQAQARPN